MGRSVAGLGNLDGDAYADVIVGAYEPRINGTTNNGPGYVRIYYGPDGSRSETIALPPVIQVNAFWGVSVYGAGDVTGDGVPDAIAGAFGFNVDVDPVKPGAEQDVGYAAVISGASINAGTPAVHHQWTGEAENDQFGRYVAAAPDIDNDQVAELLVGAHLAENPNCSGIFKDHGYVAVLSGSSGSEIDKVYGNCFAGHFGNSLNGFADVDNDGFGDFIAGASFTDYARIISGKDGSTIKALTPPAPSVPGIFFGHTVRAIGSITGDSRPELVVGAPFDDVNGADSGSVWVYAF